MRSIDGVRHNPYRIPKQNIKVILAKPAANPLPVALRRENTRASGQQTGKTKNVLLFKFTDTKQLATIAATFVVTFTFSIATSRGLAAIAGPAQPVPARQISAPGPVDPLSITNQPDELTLDPEVLTAPGEVYLPKEKLTLPDPLQKRKEFLEKYLRARNSPLADHVDAISEQSQWKLIIAISRAESSFCKYYVTNNCWGIGGAWNMKRYKNFDEAVADVNRILETKYIQAGLNTPKKIMPKYVGYKSVNWETAVQQELDNLSSAP